MQATKATFVGIHLKQGSQVSGLCVLSSHEPRGPFTVASAMIENSKSKIRQFLPMSFLSKSWSPRFRPGGPLFVTRITRGFFEKKGILKKSRNCCKRKRLEPGSTRAFQMLLSYSTSSRMHALK